MSQFLVFFSFVAFVENFLGHFLNLALKMPNWHPCCCLAYSPALPSLLCFSFSFSSFSTRQPAFGGRRVLLSSSCFSLGSLIGQEESHICKAQQGREEGRGGGRKGRQLATKVELLSTLRAETNGREKGDTGQCTVVKKLSV